MSTVGAMTPGWPSNQISKHGTPGSSLLLFAVVFVWSLRFIFGRRAALNDLATSAVVSLFLYWRLSLQIFFYLAADATYVGLCLAVLLSAWAVRKRSTSSPRHSIPKDAKEEGSDLPPLIIPCRTTHIRLFPTKHSFSYSYLYVGIPVGWTGRAGTVLSTDRIGRRLKGDARSTWLSVEAEDYLHRGIHKDGLRGKLSNYLRGQGVPPEQYPHAILVTAPRFLGFSFNPVSFWYLYTETKALGAMILEVNNTFDERRIYFMERSAPTIECPGSQFMHEWDKDFHVSPFNSRDGSYSLKARDPFSQTGTGGVRVDCNITLKSLDQKAKLIACVFSVGDALEAESMTRGQTVLFVFRWWWVGLMTNPRILREARSLWAKKLQLYYRPEVMKTSIGRQETPEETQLERSFHSLLQHLADGVEPALKTLHFVYIAAAGPSRGTPETIRSSKPGSSDDARSMTEIRVLTPAFYSQFARFTTYREAFDKLCFNAAESEKHVLISEHQPFVDLLAHTEYEAHRDVGMSLRWRVLGCFRKSVLLTPSACNSVLELSQLDRFVLAETSPTESTAYCRSLLTLLVADRFAFGSTSMLRSYVALTWTVLACASIRGTYRLVTCSFTGGLAESWLTLCSVMGFHFWAIACSSI